MEDAFSLTGNPSTGRDTKRETRRLRGVIHAGFTLGAIGLVAVAFPRLIGASWREIATAAAAIPGPLTALLLLLWAAGLVSHTITLSAALPGLCHRRALLLSLTGSAVANVLPLGGVAGVAVNDHMTRRWGFSRVSFATYTVVTNVWDVFTRMFLPILLLPLLLGGGRLDHRASRALLESALIVTVIGAAAAVLLFSPVLRRMTGGLGGAEPRHRWRSRVRRALEACENVRVLSVRRARECWGRLTVGIVLYTALVFALLLACLSVTGAAVPLAYVLMAFCAERLLTLIGVTPGAVGLTEVGLAAVLMMAPGASGPGVAVGVLLYRLLTFGLEIPVGGALLGLWFWRAGRHRPVGVDGAAQAGGA